jgi:hypothetical protein
MKKITWWIALVVLVGIQAFGFLCATMWLNNLFRKLSLFWDSVQSNPAAWDRVRIGEMDATLFVKNLQVDAAIVGNGLNIAIAAMVILTVFAIVSAVVHARNRKNRTQPATPPYSEPATRPPQG